MFKYAKITLLGAIILSATSVAYCQAIIADHNATTAFHDIPDYWIEKAKSDLHIAYEHTSHGSQLISGMDALENFTSFGTKYAWNNGETGGALDLHNDAMQSYSNPGETALDLGYYPDWVHATENYLDDGNNQDVNVIMWSWCALHANQEEINEYLNAMSALEVNYPDVTFIYMTAHCNGDGESGAVHIWNRAIRDYCVENNKILFDFYDIELYDPNGNYFGNKRVDDSLYYDSDDNGSRDKNWASEYLAADPDPELFQLVNGTDGYSGCGSWPHSPESGETPDARLNCILKGRAIWWLFARIAGWDGQPYPCPNLDSIDVVNFGDFTVLADDWLLSDPCLTGDLNDSNSVDMNDIAILSSYWLADCNDL